MASPSKIRPDSLVHSQKIEQSVFNYAKYADMENELTPEVLVDFLCSRFDQQKQNLIDRQTLLQQEKSDIHQTVNELQKIQNDKEKKVKYILEKRQQEAIQIKSLNKVITENQKKIEEKRQKIQDKRGPIKQLSEALEVTKKEINEKNLKAVFKYLERKNNEAPVYVMEALIGLMRGSKRADAMSVELYTKVHEGFMMALNRIDVKQLNVDYCQEHLDNLRDKYDHVLREEGFDIFRPHRNILSKICLLAMLGSDEYKLEQQIQKKEIEIENSQKQIEQKENLLKILDLHEFIAEDIEYFEINHVQVFNEKERSIDEELKTIKQQLADIESQFFADLN
eukprot:403361794